MASSGPTANSIWRHLPLPAAPVLARPAPLATDDSRLNGIRTHMTTLNASVEALSTTLTATTSELGDAKREVRALADLQSEALQNITGEVTRLVNRSQTAILDCLGAPAQSKDISELTSLARINTVKLDALDARVSTVDSTVRALQTRFDAFERQLAEVGTTFMTITDQQSRSLMQLTLLLQTVLPHVQSVSQPPSVVSATRKRARSVTDGEASSPLAHRRTRGSHTEPAIRPSSDDQNGSRGSTDTYATYSSFIPRQVMPGTFVKPSRPVPHSPSHPSFAVDFPTVASSDPSGTRSPTRPVQQISTSPKTPTTMTTGTVPGTSPDLPNNPDETNNGELPPARVAPSEWLNFDDLDSDETEP